MPPLTVFLVEDSPVIRENLIDTLEECLPLKFVGSAEREDTAISWLADDRHMPDCVIIDIFLKQGSGFGVLDAAMAASKRPVCVVLTNYATKDMRRRCLDAGATRVFDKTDEIEELISFFSEQVP